MRINKIWISHYKNLKNLTLDFTKRNNLITLLVGQNGLGKSNLIEILALIFRDLDILKTKEEFESWSYQNEMLEYEIKYECHDIDIFIKCYAGGFETSILNDQKNWSPLELSEFLRNKQKYLPNYIIGYYSGENKRVRDIIKVHEILENKSLKEWHRRKTEQGETGLRKLFFTENSHSQLVLLTLALYVNDPEYGNYIKNLFKKYLNITSFTRFNIRFKSPEWFKSSKRNDGIDNLISNINKRKEDTDWVEYPFWGLKGSLDQLLTRFYNHQVEKKLPLLYPEKDNAGGDYEIIEFDNIDLSQFAIELKGRFPHPIDFFYAIEALDLVGAFESVTMNVKKRGIKEDFAYGQLSEGEQQLLTVLGLILITGKEDCLFLLDEPDTHLNPIWQRDYVELLGDFNLNDDNSHIIVATHSPLIVQSSQKANVVLFYQNEKRKIKAEVSEIEFHRWRIDHVLTSPYFNFASARPKDEELDSYMAERIRILSKSKITKADEKILKSYEDDFGLMPTGETYHDLVAMNKIRNFADHD